MAFQKVTAEKLANAIQTACERYLNPSEPTARSCSSSGCSTSLFHFFQHQGEDGIDRAHTISAYAKFKPHLHELLYLLQRVFISDGNWNESSLKPILLDELIKQLGIPEESGNKFTKLIQEKKANYYLKKLSEHIRIALNASPKELPAGLKSEQKWSLPIIKFAFSWSVNPAHIEVLKFLEKEHLLNSEILKELPKMHDDTVEGLQQQARFVNSLKLLKDSNIFNHDYYSLLCQRPKYADNLAFCMSLLHKNQLFTPANLTPFCQHYG